MVRHNHTAMATQQLGEWTATSNSVVAHCDGRCSPMCKLRRCAASSARPRSPWLPHVLRGCRQQRLPVCADLRARVNMLDQMFVGNDGLHLPAGTMVSEITPSDKTKDSHLLICKEGGLPAESWGAAPAAARGGACDPDITGPCVTLIGPQRCLCTKL